MQHLAEYGALLAAAFLSATIFPFQSEVVLFGMLVAEHYTWWLLVLVASVGNTLGSVARAYDQAFPLEESAIVVIDASSSTEAGNAASSLADCLASSKNRIETVEIPGTSPYFQNNGLGDVTRTGASVIA